MYFDSITLVIFGCFTRELESNNNVQPTKYELLCGKNFSIFKKYQDQFNMKNTFNRQVNRFGSIEKNKGKSSVKFSKGQPTSKEIELATEAYLSEGGKIDRVALNHGKAEKEVFRANLEPESRLGMGTLVDDSWDCWENKDYDSNPNSGI